jgi:hypothetical protein
MTSEPAPLPFDSAYFTKRQREHMRAALEWPNGPALLVAYYEAIRHLVDAMRKQGATRGEIIRRAMTVNRHLRGPDDAAKILPITRGILAAILEESTR